MDSIPSDALQGAQGQGQDDEERAKRAADEQQLRRDLLTQILDTGARERCTSSSLALDIKGPSNDLTVSRISLVSQQRAQQIEGVLLRMAQGGQLRSKVTEPQLVDLLDQVRTFCHLCGKASLIPTQYSSRAGRMEQRRRKPRSL